MGAELPKSMLLDTSFHVLLLVMSAKPPFWRTVVYSLYKSSTCLFTVGSVRHTIEFSSQIFCSRCTNSLRESSLDISAILCKMSVLCDLAALSFGLDISSLIMLASSSCSWPNDMLLLSVC
ncbi:hypothetical protein BpHYR1_041003 [Brachionus plicatilis]|uniref:Uncharacterized protein n=1 Tax=Brachionus plicatilis TaxID=10195 RepID=A0A3M7QXE0_BRAPC|nr:hypothetical protein BpHYR1_041003 [Brachionus plicatilis]